MADHKCWAVKRLGKFILLAWALWALDLDDFTGVKAQRILRYESWRECTYASIVQTRGELNDPNPTLPPGRKQPDRDLSVLTRQVHTTDWHTGLESTAHRALGRIRNKI
jgi:hypothetical protein